MKNVFTTLFIFTSLLVSCTKENEPVVNQDWLGSGLFILNEGNFNAGNGSLSFYSMENGSISNDLFTGINKRALGDIPSFFAIDDTVGYIIVNNSGTIEKIDMKTMESIGTVTGLNSPRQMVIYNGTGYVSSLYSSKITLINLTDFTIESQIDLGCTSDALVISGSTLFAANYYQGNKVMAVNLIDNTILEIATGIEPESMVLDKENNLWVLCTGGWNNEAGQLFSINTSTLSTEKTLTFSSVEEYPTSLSVNSGGDTLYYINNGIYRMPIDATVLPSEALVESGTNLFYKVASAPIKGMFFATDAADYVQTGHLLIFNKDGEVIDTEGTGIIPGFMLYSGKQ